MTSDSVFVGDSRMAAQMRQFDWAASPLGAPAGWPESLKTACRICLTSRFPILLWWGPELRMLYNDGYVPMLGDKHPALGEPGQRVWSDIWPIVGPMLHSVISRAAASWSDDELLPMQRRGYWEETYFTFSYSPLYGPAGGVAGVFTAVTETTPKVLATRRLRTLTELGEVSGARLSDVESTLRAILDVLGRHREDVPHAAAYAIGSEVRLAGAYGLVPESPAAPAVLPASTSQPVLRSGIRSRYGKLLLPVDSAVGPIVADHELVLPVTAAGQEDPLALLVLGVSPMRALDDDYRQFFDLIGQHTGTALSDAIAAEAERRRVRTLAELDRAKSAFFANVSHELRTPLTLISVPTDQALADAGSLSPAHRHQLEVIARNTRRLRRLVDDLLDVTQLSSGGMEPRLVPVDLAATTRELVESFLPVTEKAGLELDLAIEPLPAAARVDPRMWEKIVLNLLANAVKFTDAGRIRVALGDGDGVLRFTVADQGIGIAAEHLPRLFERFYRVPQTPGRSHEGAGIGLALVRELVALHGGTVEAQSTAGEGSTFVVTMPYSRADTAGTSTEPSEWAAIQEDEAMGWVDQSATPESVDGPAERPLVLIVEDNRDMRELLQTTLGEHWRVASARNGAEALTLVERYRPDLVLTDVMMPRVDGIALVRRLRANPATESTPVILLSARAGMEAAVDGLDAGADDYLVKPFSSQELVARVRGSLELSRLRMAEGSFRKAILNSMQDGFAIADADGTVIEVNAAFETLTGYGPDGVPYPFPYPWTAPSDEPECLQVGQFVTPIRHHDGRRLWLAASVTPVVGPDGTSSVSVAALRDVTAERAAAARQETLTEFASLVGSSPSGVDVLHAGVRAIGEAFGCPILAARWSDGEPPYLVGYHRAADWPTLAEATRRLLTEAREARTFRLFGDVTTHDLAFPVGVRGDTVVCLRLAPGRHLDADQRILLELLAVQLSQALSRAQSYDEARAIALTLQHAILGPTDLPPGFAVRYQPAVEPLEVGGDWHDVVRMPSGRIGVVVGDCVGRGLAAASVMGQLRSASRALLLRNAGPAQALVELDAFAATVEGAFCATVFCAVIDPATGTVTYSSAGHPPPIVADPTGGARLLDAGRGVPLAAIRAPRAEAEVDLAPGATLLLYTDGLVERRTVPINATIATAADLLTRTVGGDADAIADVVMTDLRPADGFDDDVAILVYRQAAGALDTEIEADPRQLKRLRQEVAAWLSAYGVSEEQIGPILVAVCEAGTNAIEHSYRDRPAGRIRVTGRIDADRLDLTVNDTGAWRDRPAASDLRGRGIPLMRAFMDTVSIAGGPTGTTVHMTKLLSP